MATGFYPSFRSTSFFVLWASMTAAYCAIWMQDTALGWLMTEYNASPQVISLLQVTTSLPILLLALPGGVLGDIFDRRKLLIGVQLVLAANAAWVTLVIAMGWGNVMLLLAANGIAGCCLALSSPVRHALTPMLVERHAFVGAVTLNSIGFNASRLIGPAVAGGIIALASPAWAFAASTLIISFVTLLLVVRLEVPARKRSLDFSNPLGAGLAALRFAVTDRVIRKILLILLTFSAFAGVIYALLPLIMRQHLGAQEATYGLGMVSLGAGAIIGGSLLGLARRYFSMDMIQALAGALVMLGIAVIGMSNLLPVGMIGFFLSGAGWVMTLSTLNAELQLHVEDDYRARVTSLALMANSLGLVVASPLWGRLVGERGIAFAMFTSVALLALLFVVRFVVRSRRT